MNGLGELEAGLLAGGETQLWGLTEVPPVFPALHLNDSRFRLDCCEEDEVWLPSDQTLHWGKKPQYTYPSVHVVHKEQIPEIPRGSRLVAKLLFADWSWDEETLLNEDTGTTTTTRADPATTACFEDEKSIVPFEKGVAVFRHLRISKAIKLKKTETCTIHSLSFEIGYHDSFSKNPFKPLEIYLSKPVKIHVVAHKGSVKLMQKYGLLPNTVKNGLTMDRDDSLELVPVAPLERSIPTKRRQPDTPFEGNKENSKSPKNTNLQEIMEEIGLIQERMDNLRKMVGEFILSSLPQQVSSKILRVRCNPEEFSPVMFIFYAMRIQNLNLLQNMMATFKLDISAKDTQGNSLLHIAARSAFIDGVKWCLENGATVNATSFIKSTPLHQAYLRNDKEIRAVLKSVNADTNAMNIFGYKPRDYHNQRQPLAKRHEYLRHGCVEVVIDGFPEPFVLSVWFAARIGWLDVVKTYISDFGLDVDSKSTNGQTALMCAAEYNHPHVVKYLLKEGADPNVRDIHDRTSLHYGYMNYSFEIVQLLEEHGADAQLLNIWGKSPLWYKHKHQGFPSSSLTQTATVNNLFRSLA